MPTEAFQVTAFQGTFRVLSGVAKEYWGRALSDGAMEAVGKVERLAGHASLACARHRLRTERSAGSPTRI
jgi:uncharacterized protein YjbJ (UPF0337 family)